MHACLLVGSARGSASTSHSLGAYLLQKLEALKITTRTVFIRQSLSSPEGIADLLEAVEQADVLVLAAPLFADSHHASVIRVLELIHANIRKNADGKKRVMTAISNCGFPEADQNDVSLRISRQFASACGFQWAGGLALGGGEVIHGKPLDQAGRVARNIRKSLDAAASALSRGDSLPKETVSLMAKPLMPSWLYTLGGNPFWVWLQAKRNGCKTSIRARIT